MTSLFTWQVFEEGEWGTIAADYGLGLTPLITRREDLARDAFKPLAELHARGSNLPVRLARFEFAEELERIR